MNVIEANALENAMAARGRCAVHAGHSRRARGRSGRTERRRQDTLLNLAVASRQTAGTVAVLGGTRAGRRPLDGIAFVAQDVPCTELSVADMLRLTRNLNRQFDQRYAARLGELGIPVKRKAGKLSVASRRSCTDPSAGPAARLLVLDEPMAMLDPLARHEFMATAMTAMVDDGVVGGAVLARAGRARAGRLPHSAVRRQRAGGRRVDDLLAPPRADRPGRRS